MNVCKASEPKVITNAMLEKCAEAEAPKGEAGRLAEMEGIPLHSIKQIRLEFMNILRIDHLWVLTSVTKLSLNCNLIEKIENLDMLHHLVELDLSFNKITKIENLDTLTKLTKLSFFDNHISVLENMDALTNLTILSVGRNLIEDAISVLYLRRFTLLQSLNMVDNPVADMYDFRLYIAAFLPQVIYYEYKLVLDMEKELGNELFGQKLRTLLDAEAGEREKRERDAREKAEAELNSSSFVEYMNTDYLFRMLFENDVDGHLLMQVGEEGPEFYIEFEEQFNATCKQIFDIGQTQYTIRKTEHEQFLSCVNEAKTFNQTESIKHMELFMEEKAHIFYEVKQYQVLLEANNVTYDEYIEYCDSLAEKYDGSLHEMWKHLMKLEMELYEQIEEVNTNFEHAMTELVNVFVEACQACFSQIRVLEVTFSENISEYTQRLQTLAHLEPDSVYIPDVVKSIMVDKDSLLNAIATSHDMHLQFIDNREDTLVSRSRDWCEELVDELVKGEIKRNRGKILEINHFLDIQRQEFADLNVEKLNEDMEAVLE